MHIEISKVGNNFEVTKMYSSSLVIFKDYDNITNLPFQNVDINLANRVGSNQLLIAIKDDYPHIVAKDPSLKVHINYQKKINTFTEIPQTKTKVIHKPILVQEEKKTSFEEIVVIKEEVKPKIIQEAIPPTIPPTIPPVVEEIKVTEVKEEEKIILTPQESILAKIDKINKLLRHVVKSEIQHGFLLCGTSGIGKSFLVEELLEEEFNYRRDLHYILYKGTMSEAGLFTVIRKNPNKVIILDDCDSVWGNDNILNMLKGGLDSTVPKVNKKKFVYEVKYVIVEEGLVYDSTQDTYSIYIDDAHTEEECRTLFNKRIKYLSTDDSEDLVYQIVEIIQVPSEFVKPKRFVSKVTTKKKQDMPIEFKGKIIFVSNWELDKFDVNLRNRIKMCPFSLDRQEVVYYIKLISSKLMPQIKDDNIKNEVLDFYLQNPQLPLDIRIFVNSIDLAVTSPHDWKELLN